MMLQHLKYDLFFIFYFFEMEDLYCSSDFLSARTIDSVLPCLLYHEFLTWKIYMSVSGNRGQGDAIG